MKECHKIKLKDWTLTYTLERKQVKYINMRVKSDSTVWVSASRRVPLEEIEALIIEKQEYIKKAIQEFDEERKSAPMPKKYESGETFYFLGKPLCLKVETAGEESVEAVGECLYLKVKDQSDVQQKEQLVQKWFQEQAKILFLEVVEEIYPMFEEYGVSYPQITIRTMRSRWGSCQPRKGKITLNTHLVSTPRACVEYVVLHEFSHFIFQDHSRFFWSFVEERMPDCKERREELKRYGRLVIG